MAEVESTPPLDPRAAEAVVTLSFLAAQWTSVGLLVLRSTMLDCKGWFELDYGVGLVFFPGVPLVPRRGTLNALAYQGLWTISCSQLWGNRLGTAPSSYNMTAH